MRKFIVMLVAAIAAFSASGAARAQERTQSYGLVMPELGAQFSVRDHDAVSTYAGGTIAAEAGANTGLIASGRITDTGGSMFAGPAAFVGPHLVLGWPMFGAIARGNSYETRVRIMAIYDGDRVSGVAMGDIGTQTHPSPLWGSIDAAYHVNTLVGLGAHVQSDAGFGPRMEFYAAKGWSLYVAEAFAPWSQVFFTEFMGVRAYLR